MLKRLLGILFTLAALATFVWVALGRHSSWCFGRETAAVETTLPGDPSDPSDPSDLDDPADPDDPDGAGGADEAGDPAHAQPTAANLLQ